MDGMAGRKGVFCVPGSRDAATMGAAKTAIWPCLIETSLQKMRQDRRCDSDRKNVIGRGSERRPFRAGINPKRAREHHQELFIRTICQGSREKLRPRLRMRRDCVRNRDVELCR